MRRHRRDSHSRRHICTWVCTAPHTRRRPKGVRGITTRHRTARPCAQAILSNLCLCLALEGSQLPPIPLGLRDPWSTTQSCSPEPSHQPHEHTCGGPALLT